MKTLIGISGKKQSGKGEATKFLLANKDLLFGEVATASVFSMAGPLKGLCINLLGLSHSQVYGTDEQKNSLTRYQWKYLPHYRELADEVWYGNICKYGSMVDIWPLDAARPPSGLMTAREVMQHVGTIFRMMHADVWAEACVRSILASGADVAIIDDVRYPNEVAAIKAAGGVVVRLSRDVANGRDTHESETALDAPGYNWGNFDHVIFNDRLTVDETNEELLEKLHSSGVTRIGSFLET